MPGTHIYWRSMSVELIVGMIIFLYGAVLGSFVNVLIYRIPKKEDFTLERSHCMKCGSQIKWYDLFPIVSYIILGGKCRSCKEKISIQYPVIETANAVAYVFIFALYDLSVYSVLYCLMFSIFLAISIIDFRTFEIPFVLNVAIFVLAVIRLFIEPGELPEHFIGLVSVSGFMLICLIIGRAVKGADAFGGGDIKLMAAAGLFLGVKEVVLGFVLGCVFGAVIHTIRMKISNADNVLAFGPYLCAGLCVAMLFGNDIIDWYLGMVL